MCQLWIGTARLDRHPANGIPFGIRHQAGRSTRIHNGLLDLPRTIAGILAVFFSAQLPICAPTTSTSAVHAEEGFEIAPEFLRKRMKGWIEVFCHYLPSTR